MQSIKKQVDTTWDFKTADTKQYTHCYHAYPAMMIPQVASRLISLYGKSAKTLFDPYCGTGTSLVEASLQGIDSVGTDLNPMARLIAEAKTTKINLQVLDLYLKEFNDFLFSLNFGTKKNCPIVQSNVDFSNIDFWFKTGTKNKLAKVKGFIDNIDEAAVQKFFLVAFSETVRESSLTRNGEFKLYRMSAAQREAFNPDVFGMITGKLARNRKGLQHFTAKTTVTPRAVIHGFNSAETIAAISLKSIDIVVTSPPYGDSKTTVAYGQFSRLSNQWLNIKNAHQIDQQLMGGKAKDIEPTGVDLIDESVEKIAVIDKKRAKEVYAFYDDYRHSIANVASVVKGGGYACYVVGNRRVKDTVLPTDEITKNLFQQHGFRHENTFIRNIPNKRMPSLNSPTNQIGKKSATMNNEYIVIMQKTA